MLDSHFIFLFHLNRFLETSSSLLSIFFGCSKPKVRKCSGVGCKSDLQLLCVFCATQKKYRDIEKSGGPESCPL